MPESCSIIILICHTCQVEGLSYWILTNVCSISERSNYFVYIKKENIIKLFTSTCEINGNKKSVAFIYSYIFIYLVQYLQFVSSALKWHQNLAGLKLVFNKLGVLWTPHWLCVLYWAFTGNFTPPYTQQYEISYRHIPSPAYQHHNMVHNICGSCWFFPAGQLAAVSVIPLMSFPPFVLSLNLKTGQIFYILYF